MITHSLPFLFASVLSFAPAAQACTSTTGTLELAVGGPARIALAGKGGGDLTAAQWKAAGELTVQGCTPGAQVVGYTVSFTTAQGVVVEQGGKGSMLHQGLKDAVAALPDGARFTVAARVIDGKGNAVKVPAATYTLRR